jgi:voltage-gated potassium channel Kch
MGAATVVVGFGVVGAAAVRQLLRDKIAPADVTVVDVRQDAVEEAKAFGVRAVLGDGMERAVLARVAGEGVRCVIVAVGVDATAVLVTMALRDLCPDAEILTALRDGEHIEHAKRAGADDVVAFSKWAGRARGFAVARRS